MARIAQQNIFKRRPNTLFHFSYRCKIKYIASLRSNKTTNCFCLQWVKTSCTVTPRCPNVRITKRPDNETSETAFYRKLTYPTIYQAWGIPVVNVSYSGHGLVRYTTIVMFRTSGVRGHIVYVSVLLHSCFVRCISCSRVSYKHIILRLVSSSSILRN